MGNASTFSETRTNRCRAVLKMVFPETPLLIMDLPPTPDRWGAPPGPPRATIVGAMVSSPDVKLEWIPNTADEANAMLISRTVWRSGGGRACGWWVGLETITYRIRICPSYTEEKKSRPLASDVERKEETEMCDESEGQKGAEKLIDGGVGLMAIHVTCFICRRSQLPDSCAGN